MTKTKLIYVDSLSTDKKAKAFRLLGKMHKLHGWKIEAAKGWSIQDVVAVTAPEESIEDVRRVSREIDKLTVAD